MIVGGYRSNRKNLAFNQSNLIGQLAALDAEADVSYM
jgi:hypothetical protein